MTADISNDVVRHLPHLRMVARALARDHAYADDLVQETAARALDHADQFRPGTNLRAWLTTILRNSYFSEQRSRRRQPWIDIDTVADSLSTPAAQESRVRMREFMQAFDQLPKIQREALTLVGANGYSYDQAARKAGCAVGTMKSRVSRARLQVQHLLDGEPEMAMAG